VKAEDAIQKAIDSVVEVKKNNQQVIAVDALIAYLNVLKSDVAHQAHFDERAHVAQLEEYKAKNANQLAHYQAQNEHALKMFDSVIAYGQMALKSAILVNGAGAVAILALMGNIWDKHVRPEAVQLLACSVTFFALATLGGAVGTGMTYLTQNAYAYGWKRRGNWLNGIVVLIVLVVCYGGFGYGVYKAYHAFVDYLGVRTP